MRNELIARIETAMAASLSTEQLAALHRVLVNETAGLEIEATIRGEETEQKDFLTAFLSAKRVEGCSDKTIHYYKITLEKMIATLGKPVQATTTDDMRHYLDDYQHSGRVGKSTIDNMRRIFSSFFAISRMCSPITLEKLGLALFFFTSPVSGSKGPIP